MEFTKKGDEFRLPTLYNKDKMGRTGSWNIYVINNTIQSNSQIGDGVIKKFKPSCSKGKNLGKKNETTDQEQALFECYSKWLKKQDQGYSTTIISKPVLLPMLANKYQDRGKKYLQLPFCVSRKLDGIRMVTQKNENNEIDCLSRMGKSFHFMENIRNQIKTTMDSLNWNIVLDGELYSHDLPFNIISGIVRQKNKKSEYEEQLQYWIFDICDDKIVYRERMCSLEIFKTKYLQLFPNGNLRFEFYNIVTSHDEIQPLHDKYVEEGFEGLMARNLDSKYIFKHRSNDLLKYKNFEDEEFTIVGYKLCKGTEQDAIVFTCRKGDKHFDVRPRGSIEKRIEWGKIGNTFIGKKLTVRYQIDSRDLEDTLPRFPVGIDIIKNSGVVRDYE